jgi:ABC-type sugar transport system ATPase subunit
MQENVIEIKNLSKSFNNIPVLKNVNIRMEPGRVYAVVGKNGAGKSTLVKLLAGIHQPDEGEICYKGRKVNIRSPKDALSLGWSFVFQDLDLFENLTIAENVYFNNFPSEWAGIVRKKKIQDMTQQLCGKVGLKADCRTKVKQLGMGEKHLVAFMRMLARDSEVMIIDEISSALTNEDAGYIFNVIQELKKRGKFIVFVTHNVGEIYAQVDNVIVLRDGEVVIQEETKRIKDRELVKSIVGQEVRKRYPKLPVRQGREVLRVEGLSVPGILDNVSFVLRRGEVLGITGLVGSGRTSLAKCIFGITPGFSGDVYYNRKRIRIRSPKAAVKYGIGLIPDDRKKEGIFNVSDLMLNITIAHLQSIERRSLRWMIDKTAEKKLATQYLHRLGVNYFSLGQQMKYLSSGNQQKVLIARWFLANTDVLILDEPTKELDIASKVEVYNLINEMVRQEKAVIFISSDFSEVIGMSDRVMVLSCGRVVMEMDKNSVTKDRILKRALDEELRRLK